MELNKSYKHTDAKYSPIIGYLSIIHLNEIKNLLPAIKNKTGIMYDYFGFEYEDDNTLTFYDFASKNEKNINLSALEIINFLEPITKEYLLKNPSDTTIFENLIREINQS